MATADGRVLSVIANVSRVSHGNRITKLDIFVTREEGEDEEHDWGWHDPRKPGGREETWDFHSHSSPLPRARIYFGTLSMIYMEQALIRP